MASGIGGGQAAAAACSLSEFHGRHFQNKQSHLLIACIWISHLVDSFHKLPLVFLRHTL